VPLRNCASPRRQAVLGVLVAVLFSACDFVTEAEFTLSKDSRLPAWFSFPNGVQKSPYSVLYTIYGPARVRMRVYGPDGAKLADIRPVFEGRIDQTDLDGKNIDDVFDRYPSYTVLSHQGRREVIEIPRMGPVFKVLDDPDLTAKIDKLIAQQ